MLRLNQCFVLCDVCQIILSMSAKTLSKYSRDQCIWVAWSFSETPMSILRVMCGFAVSSKTKYNQFNVLTWRISLCDGLSMVFYDKCNLSMFPVNEITIQMQIQGPER